MNVPRGRGTEDHKLTGTPPADKRRRRLLQSAGAAVLASAAHPTLAAAPTTGMAASGAKKVLRLLFSSAETRLDPARVSDLYSRTILAHIFEPLYGYDHLARPPKIKPVTAVGMPDVSADFRVWTIRVARGIYFADDPAFKGQRRELQARDYAYAIQRIVDPANISPLEHDVIELGIVGLGEAREAAVKGKTRFDYDRPIAGLRVLDSHTLQITVDQPRPRLVYSLADASVVGGTAREVVDHYGESIGEHPVGTGPFQLKSWRRSSRIVLERNPTYRELRYHGEPAPDDAEGQALLARFAGRRLPMVDEVDVAIIEEFQPQWLSFLNAEVDALAGVTGQLPSQFTNEATPGGKLAPNIARRGVQMYRSLAADVAYTYFNMQDPTVGGMSPPQVALRRAISLAYNVEEEIRTIRRGQAIIGQGPLMPYTSGYSPHFKSEMGDYDPARARALLDLYGFVDRDGDGWRERPDGSQLELEMATEPEQIYRSYNEQWQKNMKAVGIRIRFKTQQWPENLKAADAGKLMMWMLGGAAASPDGIEAMRSMYGPASGDSNLARFNFDAFDKMFVQMQALPDGPERERLLYEGQRVAVVYMPYKIHAHRIFTDLTHAWVVGFRRPLFWNEWWHTVDIDNSLRSKA
jgi:ABC-type transport system substrate-binding protein